MSSITDKDLQRQHELFEVNWSYTVLVFVFLDLLLLIEHSSLLLWLITSIASLPFQTEGLVLKRTLSPTFLDNQAVPKMCPRKIGDVVDGILHFLSEMSVVVVLPPITCAHCHSYLVYQWVRTLEIRVIKEKKISELLYTIMESMHPLTTTYCFYN